MEELVKGLAEQPIAAVSFGLGMVLLYAVRLWGLKVGERGGANERTSAQVAAVIVDPTALNAAKDAVVDLTKTIAAEGDREKDHAHMICRRVENLTESVDELSRVIDGLKTEIIRRH